MAIDYLIQRGTTWHARIDIPVDIRPAFGNKRVLSKSLKTGDKILARELAAQQVCKWKQEFRKARDAKLALGDAWKEALADTARTYAAQKDAMLLSAFKSDAAFAKELEGITSQEFSNLRAEYEDDVSSLLAVASAMEQGYSYPNLTKIVSANLFDDTQSIQDRFQSVSEIFSNLVAHKAKAENQLNASELEEALAISFDPTVYKPKSPISSASIKAFQTHLETQMGNASSRNQVMSKVKAFSKWLSNQGVLLSFDSVANYLDSLSNKAQTRTTHLSALRKYHKWACRYDHPYRDQFAHLVSPFDGHTHAKVGDGASESWVAFTLDEVTHLHNAAIEKGDVFLANLIVFACYTGCRIEEIGRISKATTDFEDSKPIAFRVEDSKTKAGIRTVPIHPKLQPLYIQLLNESEDGYLFKGKPTAQGLRLKQPQTRFSKLKTAQGYSKLHVFHSFRKTCATALEHSGATGMVMSSILGHIRGSLTLDVYSAGASFEQKKGAIEKLDFNF